MTDRRVYWGCTTLAGCELGFGGAETDFPRDVTVCPCCGGELAEITATMPLGMTDREALIALAAPEPEPFRQGWPSPEDRARWQEWRDRRAAALKHVEALTADRETHP